MSLDQMERLYAQSEYSLGEQVSLAAGRMKLPYRATIEDFERIHCGHDPYLFGRRVRDLRAEVEDGEEILRWDELEVKQEWIDRVASIREENRRASGHSVDRS